jgi:hypothetical protein
MENQPTFQKYSRYAVGFVVFGGLGAIAVSQTNSAFHYGTKAGTCGDIEATLQNEFNDNSLKKNLREQGLEGEITLTYQATDSELDMWDYAFPNRKCPAITIDLDQK